MGSTASQLLSFIPGMGRNQVTGLSNNLLPMAAPGTNGTPSMQAMQSSLPSWLQPSALVPNPISGVSTMQGTSPEQRRGFGQIGNIAEALLPAGLAVGGNLLTNRQPQSQGTGSVPRQSSPSPLQANQTPVGLAQTVKPISALAAYQKLLSGAGNS